MKTFTEFLTEAKIRTNGIDFDFDVEVKRGVKTITLKNSGDVVGKLFIDNNTESAYYEDEFGDSNDIKYYEVEAKSDKDNATWLANVL